MKKITISALLVFSGMNIYSQTELTVNEGTLSVLPDTEVSTGFDFENKSTGNVINDGNFHFYGDYKNEGLFSYTTNTTTGYVVFEGNNKPIQNISGSSPSNFYDVLFNKAAEDYSFHLSNDIAAKGTVNLYEGVVYNDKTSGGAFIFLKGSNHINTTDKSHVHGEVIKEGNESFRYPIGKGGYYRFAAISSPSSEAHAYLGEYHLENSDTKYPHRNRTGVIDLINSAEYWTVDQAPGTEGSVILTLSWDERTTPQNIYGNGASDVHIVRWDEADKIWVDEGGIVDYAAKTVTSPINVDGFGVFTLAKIKSHLINDGEVVIYNGVTPDGDGMNDYFIIDNINNFPNNRVTIFNRWGREVYKTTSYDSHGNVFRGKAEGVNTFGKEEKLPSGTYYYIVEYFYDRDGASHWVKKTGYLHLENN